MNDNLKDSTDAVSRAARDLFHAGLGMAAVLQEEARKTFDTFVEKGEEVDENREKTAFEQKVGDTFGAAEDRARRVSDKFKATGDEIEETISEVVAKVLHRLNVPTREDVQTLRESVERLNRKVEELRGS
jgi:poly(hydroxyalkanoate) granule-associated protein